MNMTLPTDSEERKGFPLLGGVLRYFPAALAGVARWSKIGNDKHNPGQPLHHSRGKSMDHGDCIVRHLMDLQDLLSIEENADGSQGDPQARILFEADALAWRALALSQELHERLAGAPLAPGANTPKAVIKGSTRPAAVELVDEPQTEKPRIREVWALKVDGGGYIDGNGRITSKAHKALAYASKEDALLHAPAFGADVVQLS